MNEELPQSLKLLIQLAEKAKAGVEEEAEVSGYA